MMRTNGDTDTLEVARHGRTVRTARWATFFSCVVAMHPLGCDDSGDSGDADGGEAGDATGGTGSDAGSGPTGGTAGATTGGSAPSGGTDAGGEGGETEGGSGGSNSSGSGGQGAIGGSGRAGGSGGAAGTGGTAKCVTTYGFDADVASARALYADPTSLVDDSTIAWDGTEGDPADGSVRATIPFSGPDQVFGLTLSPVDLHAYVVGKTFELRAMLASGLATNASIPGRAKLVLKSGTDYIYASGAWTNLEPGEWVTLTIDPEHPDYVDDALARFDPLDVREISVEITTGGDSTATFEEAEILVDTLRTCGSDEDAPTRSTLVWWNEVGLVSSGTNPFGIHGLWYTYDDCSDVAEAVTDGSFLCPANPVTPNCCTSWDASLVGPAPESKSGYQVTAGVAPESSGTLCVKGVGTEVLNGVNGMPAYAPQWGAGTALLLNSTQPFDATRAFTGGPIKGMSFDIVGPTALNTIQVGVNTLGGGAGYTKEISIPTVGATVLFSELEQAPFVQPRVPLDPTELVELTFFVYTVVERSTPFEFCLENLRVLQ